MTLYRKELNKILDELEPEDMFFVTDFTKTIISMKDLFLLVEKIKIKGSTLKSIKGTSIDLII